MFRHRSALNESPILYHRPKQTDHNLSKINQVYFVTKQIPQQECIKPQLTYLPIIQQSPSTYQHRTHTFMSSALLSSVHSIDLDSVKLSSNKYFQTVLPKKKMLTRSQTISSNPFKNNSVPSSDLINSNE